MTDIKQVSDESEVPNKPRRDFLRNSADDHSAKIFDPSVMGKTDRFVLRFEKPR